jgi:L-aspartate oxidase
LEAITTPWDVVVIGSGVAGLMSALELPQGLRVLLLGRHSGPDSASRWAQGGLAAAVGGDDSPELHRQDTLNAGAGLCEPQAVELLVSEAPRCVERLLGLGLQLDRQGDQLSTTLEAAHSRRRVLHAHDQTGLALVELLEQRVAQRPGLSWLHGALALQLWVEAGRCCGLQLLHQGQLGWVRAGAVVLASGGCGHLFSHTTNPVGSHGDGIAMAWEAGALLRDMEFVQFHPTALMQPGAPHFLLSEALRGEGARLLDAAGRPLLMPGGELLPRDQLSRLMVQRMQQMQLNALWLDLRPVGQARLEKQFPMILGRCQSLGLNPLQVPLPVAPAAHYWMGGVATDLKAATSLAGLYAVGEVASSGVHGANRLASNSLSECLVMARQLRNLQPQQASASAVKAEPTGSLNWNPSPALLQLAADQLQRLRELSWQAAGVERQGPQLRRALRQWQQWQQRLALPQQLAAITGQDYTRCNQLSLGQAQGLEQIWERRQRGLATGLLLEAAAFRQESRGGHYRNDCPASQPFWQRHSLQERGYGIRSCAAPDSH